MYKYQKSQAIRPNSATFRVPVEFLLKRKNTAGLLAANLLLMTEGGGAWEGVPIWRARAARVVV